jgi:hypothetical protein
MTQEAARDHVNHGNDIFSMFSEGGTPLKNT